MEPNKYYNLQSDPIIKQPNKDINKMLGEIGPMGTKHFLKEAVGLLIKEEKGYQILEGYVRMQYSMILKEISQLKSEDNPVKWNDVISLTLALINVKECAVIFMCIEMEAVNVDAKIIEYFSVLGNLLRYFYFD